MLADETAHTPEALYRVLSEENEPRGEAMSDNKRMLILPADLVRKVDENRGDMSAAEFIEFLIDSRFNEVESKEETRYVAKEEFKAFEDGMRDLFRSFLDFFLSYGLEMGRPSSRAGLEELSHKLRGLEDQLGSGKDDSLAKIKWK